MHVMLRVRRWCSTYQAVHTAQRVIGVVQGVGQLVHAVIGLTVAIETHTHRDAAERRGVEAQVSCIPFMHKWGQAQYTVVFGFYHHFLHQLVNRKRRKKRQR